MKTLQIDEIEARELYKDASPKLANMLEKAFGKALISFDVRDRIKTVEDALRETGKEIPDFSSLPPVLQKRYRALFVIETITEALNEGWQPDWSLDGQKKWQPYYPDINDSEVLTLFICSAGPGFSLCFKTSALAEYAGKQFKEAYKRYILSTITNFPNTKP